jgi:hypothetical protein
MSSSQVPATLRRAQPQSRWYGSDRLWVALPDAGSTIRAGEQQLRVKFPSFTLDKGGAMAPGAAAPQVGAEPFQGSGAGQGSTGGYASAHTDDGQPISWWPTVIQVPHPGCWRVNESLGDTTVRFVVRIS